MNKGKEIINKKRFILFILVIATFLMGIGYASVNSVILSIDGSVSSLLLQEGVIITSVDYSESIDTNKSDSKIINVSDTVVNSKIVLGDNLNSSITYTITVNNFTDADYTFIDTVFYNDFYDNPDITFELTGIQYGYELKKGSYVTFDITFKYVDGVDISEISNELNSYLNFRFLRVLDYIESTGTQYIDTLVMPDNNTTFEMDFSLSDIETPQALYGTRVAMGDLSHNMFFYYTTGKDDAESNLQIRWDDVYTSTYIDLNYSEGKKINVLSTSDNINFSTNDKTVSMALDASEWSLSSSIYVFNMSQQDTFETRYARMKLYYLKIYQGSDIVRDFIPVLDDSGVACLYDLVDNEYFYNKGTGNFEYGDEYTVVEYIKSTGIQYVDLNYYSSNLTKVEYVMALEDLTTTQAIFGSRNGQMDNSFNMFLYNSLLRYDYLSTVNYLTYTDVLTDPTHITVEKAIVTMNSNVVYEETATDGTTESTDSFTSTYSMYLFSVNDGGSAFSPSSGMRLYYFKIFENGSIVKNLIPVLDKNGVACLYDLISNEYYYNVYGTSNFVYG